LIRRQQEIENELDLTKAQAPNQLGEQISEDQSSRSGSQLED